MSLGGRAAPTSPLTYADGRWACGGGGVDCGQVNEGGFYYIPNTVKAHANFVYDHYYSSGLPLPFHQNIAGGAGAYAVPPPDILLSNAVGWTLPASWVRKLFQASSTKRFQDLKEEPPPCSIQGTRIAK
eukprot:gene18002-biopygen40808